MQAELIMVSLSSHGVQGWCPVVEAMTYSAKHCVTAAEATCHSCSRVQQGWCSCCLASRRSLNLVCQIYFFKLPWIRKILLYPQGVWCCCLYPTSPAGTPFFSLWTVTDTCVFTLCGSFPAQVLYISSSAWSQTSVSISLSPWKLSALRTWLRRRGTN